VFYLNVLLELARTTQEKGTRKMITFDNERIYHVSEMLRLNKLSSKQDREVFFLVVGYDGCEICNIMI